MNQPDAEGKLRAAASAKIKQPTPPISQLPTTSSAPAKQPPIAAHAKQLYPSQLKPPMPPVQNSIGKQSSFPATAAVAPAVPSAPKPKSVSQKADIDKQNTTSSSMVLANKELHSHVTTKDALPARHADDKKPAASSAANSISVNKSVLSQTIINDDKITLVIEFDEFFKRAGAACKVQVLCLELVKLLKLKCIRIKFLCVNVRAAKILLSNYYTSAKQYLTEPSEEYDVEFIEGNSQTLSAKRESFLTPHQLSETGLKSAENTIKDVSLIVFHSDDKLGTVIGKTCRAIRIQKTFVTTATTIRIEQHLIDLQALYSELTQRKKSLDAAERARNIERIEREAAAMHLNPEFMELKQKIEFQKGELELMGDINLVLAREKNKRELGDFFRSKLPAQQEVVYLYAATQIFDTFQRCLSNSDINIAGGIDEIKKKMLGYILSLGDGDKNWVKNQFFQIKKSNDKYELYCELLELMQEGLIAKIEKGDGGYNGVSRDPLQFDCRILCNIYNIEIHAIERIDDRVIHYLVNKNTVQVLNASEMGKIFLQKYTLHFIFFEEENQYGWAQKNFMPIVPVAVAQKYTDKIFVSKFDLNFYTNKILTKFNTEMFEILKISDSKLRDFIFELFVLYDREVEKALLPSDKKETNVPILKRPSASGTSELLQTPTLSGKSSPRLLEQQNGRVRQGSLDKTMAAGSSGRSSPSLVIINGRSSPRADNVVQDRPSPRNDSNLVTGANTAGRASPMPSEKSGSGIARNVSQNNSGEISPDDRKELLCCIQEIAVLFPLNINPGLTSYYNFIQDFFLILIRTTVNRIKICVEQYRDELILRKNFSTIIDGKYAWSNIDNSEVFRAEVAYFYKKMKEQLIIWLRILGIRAAQCKTEFQFLSEAMVLIDEMHTNLHEIYEKGRVDYSEFDSRYSRKLAEKDKYQDSRYTLLISGSINTGGLTHFIQSDIYTILKEGSYTQFKSALDSEMFIGKSKFDINAPSKMLGRPDKNLLQIACGKGKFETIKLLVERKADVNHRRNATHDSPPIFHLINWINIDETNGNLMIPYLLDAGAKIVVFDPYGNTPLHNAQTYAVEILLNYLICTNPGPLTEVVFTKSTPPADQTEIQPCSAVLNAFKLVNPVNTEIAHKFFAHGRVLSRKEIAELLNINNEQSLRLLADMINKKVELYKHYIGTDKGSPQKSLSPRKGEMPQLTQDEIKHNLRAEVIAEETAWMDKLGIERPKNVKPAVLPRTDSLSSFKRLLGIGGTTNSDQKTTRSGSTPSQMDPEVLRKRGGSVIVPTHIETPRSRSETLGTDLPQLNNEKSPRAGSMITQPVASASSKGAPQAVAAMNGHAPASANSALLLKSTSSPMLNAQVMKLADQELELIKQTEDINHISENTGLAAAHIACITGNLILLNKLIEKGANLSICSDDGRTPFYFAALHKQIEIIKRLKDGYVSLLPSNDDYQKMKERESQQSVTNRDKPVKYPHCYPNLRARLTDYNVTPLHAAAARNDAELFIEIYKYMVITKSYACFYRRDIDGNMPLTLAALMLNKTILTFCLAEDGMWLHEQIDEKIVLAQQLSNQVLKKEIFTLFKEIHEEILKGQLQKFCSTSPANSVSSPRTGVSSPRNGSRLHP